MEFAPISLARYDDRDVHQRYSLARALSQPTLAQWMQRLSSHAQPQRLSSPFVLDLGCGTGRFLAPLAQTYSPAQVIGIDLSSKMLGVAKQNLNDHADSRFRLIRADAQHVPLRDQSCGLVFMSMVYHHLPDKSATLREIHRVLAQGGYFVLRTCGRELIESFLYQQFFPEAGQIDRSRLEPIDDTMRFIAHEGLTSIAHERIQQVAATSPAEYVKRIGMRGTSDLEGISDNAFHTGMRRLEAHCAKLNPSELIHETLDLLVFRK